MKTQQYFRFAKHSTLESAGTSHLNI